jgi:hypothetical protein
LHHPSKNDVRKIKKIMSLLADGKLTTLRVEMCLWSLLHSNLLRHRPYYLEPRSPCHFLQILTRMNHTPPFPTRSNTTTITIVHFTPLLLPMPMKKRVATKCLTMLRRMLQNASHIFKNALSILEFQRQRGRLNQRWRRGGGSSY